MAKPFSPPLPLFLAVGAAWTAQQSRCINALLPVGFLCSLHGLQLKSSVFVVRRRSIEHRPQTRKNGVTKLAGKTQLGCSGPPFSHLKVNQVTMAGVGVLLGLHQTQARTPRSS